MVSVMMMPVRGAVPDPRTLSFASVACLRQRVTTASGLALTAVALPRHVASHDNTDSKTRANIPSKCSRFSAGIQYDVYTVYVRL